MGVGNNFVVLHKKKKEKTWFYQPVGHFVFADTSIGSLELLGRETWFKVTC